MRSIRAAGSVLTVAVFPQFSWARSGLGIVRGYLQEKLVGWVLNSMSTCGLEVVFWYTGVIGAQLAISEFTIVNREHS